MHTETWKPIPGMPGYEASDQGRIRSFLRNPAGRVLRPAKVGRGYLHLSPCVDGKNTSRKVHHLVLLAFVGPRPDGHVACHTNDIPDDNRLANLRWGTLESNMADRLRRGWFGELRDDEERVTELATNIYLDPRPQDVIAQAYGISTRFVRAVKYGRKWAHITRQVAKRIELQALADARTLATAPNLLAALREIAREDAGGFYGTIASKALAATQEQA